MQPTNQLNSVFKPTPVFEANELAYLAGYPIICNEGGSRCFHPNTLIHTSNGLKAILSLSINDEVFTPIGLKPIEEVFANSNTKPCIKIKLKNGKEIIATEDHKFMFRQGWHELKYIVSLWNENNTQF